MQSSRLTTVCSGLLVTCVLTVAGCAAPGPGGPGAQSAEAYDPFEETNRSIFGFNQSVDRTVLVPAAETYRTVIPPPARQSIHDFLQNLNGPIIFANDVLQAEPRLASQTLARLAINTTIGVGGMFDVATRIGIPYHSNDLGITFATWGVPEGAFLVVPVLGPSNPRDLVGQIGDGLADPGNIVAGDYNLIWASIARTIAEGIDERSRNIESLADIERTSLDYYATIRSLYRQRRAAQIRHEQDNLPNPTPVQGSDSGPAMSYSFGAAERRKEAAR